MPSLSVGNDIVLNYIDSGAIENVEYTTFVIIHGHTFHTGVFKKLIPFASSKSLRVICVSRREYEGSTPYSANELKAVHQGSESSDVERAKFLQQEGVLLALFVDRLIQTLALPKKGGVVVCGWSLGNLFSIAMRASIDNLPDDTKQRLKAYSRGFVVFDPPCQALGIPLPASGYIPLWDYSIPEEERGLAFTKWVSSYYIHGDLSSRDFSQLNQREADPSKKASTDTIPLDEFLAMIDPAPGVKWETSFVESDHFASMFRKQTTKALFDPHIREDWNHTPIWYLYGEASPWNVLWGAWDVEEKDKKSEISFKSIPTANHLSPWDEPERFLSIIEECLTA